MIPDSSEDELATLVKTLSQRGFPLSESDIQRTAFEFVTKTGFQVSAHVGLILLVTFGLRDSCLATKNCAYGSQKASLHQVHMKVWLWVGSRSTKNWSNSCGLMILDDVWNYDESGLQCQFDQGHAVGEVRKPCYHITPGSKGETTIVPAAFNAGGTFAPPFIKFKGKRIQSDCE